MRVQLKSCRIRNNQQSALHVFNVRDLEISDCSIMANEDNGIFIDTGSVQRRNTKIFLNVTNCIIGSNRGKGIIIYMNSFPSKKSMHTSIYDSTFSNSEAALDIVIGNPSLMEEKHVNQVTSIRNCSFTAHKMNTGSVVDIEKYYRYEKTNNEVIIEGSKFINNSNINGKECSVLHIRNIDAVMMRDVNITDNNCTGLTLSSSKLS